MHHYVVCGGVYVCVCVNFTYNFSLFVHALFFVHVFMLSFQECFHYSWSLIWYIILTTAEICRNNEWENSGKTDLTEVPREDEQCLNYI